MARRPSFASLGSGTESPDRVVLRAAILITGHRGILGSVAGLTVPPGGATRGTTVTVNRVLSGQVSQAAPQFAVIFDASVIDQPGGRWYAGGDPCIYAADGDPMTWLTSPLVMACSGMRATEGARRPAPGLRHPGQLTDVHGREG